MTVMTDLILQSRGVVDKLMGDGIMAFWGAPNEIDNPSRAGDRLRAPDAHQAL